MSPFYFISPCHFHFKFLHTVSFRFRQWYLHINTYSYNSFLSKTICSSITQNTYMSQSLHYYNIFTFSHNLWWAKGNSYRICWWLLVFPFPMHNNADNDSLHIITFDIRLSSTHSNASNVAYNYCILLMLLLFFYVLMAVGSRPLTSKCITATP